MKIIVNDPKKNIEKLELFAGVKNIQYTAMKRK